MMTGVSWLFYRQTGREIDTEIGRRGWWRAAIFHGQEQVCRQRPAVDDVLVSLIRSQPKSVSGGGGNRVCFGWRRRNSSIGSQWGCGSGQNRPVRLGGWRPLTAHLIFCKRRAKGRERRRGNIEGPMAIRCVKTKLELVDTYTNRQ